MTRAEQIAKRWANDLFRDLVVPGELAGKNMDAAKFNVERFVGNVLPASFSMPIPTEKMAKAKIAARKEWDKLRKAHGK